MSVQDDNKAMADKLTQGQPDQQAKPDQAKAQAQPDDAKEPIKDWTEVKRIIAERDELKGKVRDMSSKLDELFSEKQARDAKAKADAEKAEMAQMEEQGKYREALQKTNQTWEERHRGYQQKVTSTLLPNAIKAAASAIPNIDPDAIEDLPALLRDRVQLDPDTLQPMVLGPDGKQLKDDSLNPISLDDFVSEFVRSRPRMLLDSTARGSGAKPGRGAGQRAVTMADLLNDPALAKDISEEDMSQMVSRDFFSKEAQAAFRKARIEKNKPQ